MRFGWPAKSSDTRLMTPGVSILLKVSLVETRKLKIQGKSLRLTLEIFHYIKESVINIGLVGKLYLDLIKVAKGILQFI